MKTLTFREFICAFHLEISSLFWQEFLLFIPILWHPYFGTFPFLKLNGQQDYFDCRCYLKLGQWQESLHGINEHTIVPVLGCYATATEHDSTWYKAWHAWAYMNFETVLFYKQQQQQLQACDGGSPSTRVSAETSSAARAGDVSHIYIYIHTS